MQNLENDPSKLNQEGERERERGRMSQPVLNVNKLLP
jgi:hypothetical protein